MLGGTADLLDAFVGITYVTGPDGKILAHGRKKWDEFAEANEGNELLGDSVIGHNLLDCIYGENVRASYAMVMDKLLTGKLPDFKMQYVCHAPETTRKMLMLMSPHTVGGTITGIVFQSILQEEKLRPPVKLFDFKALSRLDNPCGDLDVLAMCSTCQKVCSDVADPDQPSQWMEAEDYYRHGGTGRVRIVHTICDVCDKEKFATARQA